MQDRCEDKRMAVDRHTTARITVFELYYLLELQAMLHLCDTRAIDGISAIPDRLMRVAARIMQKLL